MTRRLDIDRPLHTEQTTADPTLIHAAYYGLGAALLALCAAVSVLLLIWVLAPFDLPGEALWLIAGAPIAGLGMGGVRLIQYTQQHRDWLYHVEDMIGVDLDQDGSVGAPGGGPAGTFVMCPDGVRRRLDTELTPDEVQAVKRQLLLSGKATVRGLTATVGDRASALRQELIVSGVCAQPEHEKAPALLTPAGAKAVMRW